MISKYQNVLENHNFHSLCDELFWFVRLAIRIFYRDYSENLQKCYSRICLLFPSIPVFCRFFPVALADFPKIHKEVFSRKSPTVNSRVFGVICLGVFQEFLLRSSYANFFNYFYSHFHMNCFVNWSVFSQYF